MARQETRIGVASKNASSAFYLAETGIYSTISSWNAGTMSSVGNWNTTTLTGSSTNGTWSVTVMPMTQYLYFLQSTGTVTDGGALWSGATRQVGMIVRINTANMDPAAALETQGSIKIGGSSQINGNDTRPSSWSSSLCTGSSTNKPGVMTNDTSQIQYSGNSYSVTGNPASAQDTTITAAKLTTFGDYTWDDLTAMADPNHIYSSSVTVTNTVPDSLLSGGSYTCRSTTQSNWGDPEHPTAVCGGFFPIIWARSDISINSNGSGQGILIVDGDLSVQGGFSFYGPVFVKGQFKTAGTGGHFNGGVVAANVDLSTSTVLGNAVVTYSSCAVTRAVLNNSNLSKAVPLTRRSWVDMSNIAY
jgi:hypothetical protein